jgi:ankyrin repeat protein
MKYLKFFESRQTEKQALKLIDDNDKLLNDFKDIDTSKNQILLPIIAYFYNQNNDLDTLNQIFSKIPNLLDKKLLTIQYTKNGILIKNDLFTDFIKFSEKIDAMDSAISYKNREKLNKKNLKNNTNDLDDDLDKPIFNKNGIKIFKGTDIGSCIRLGKGESFCISQPSNNMYQSYRDSKNSSFYFIYDDNNKSNPLNIVVFDNTNYGVELTDKKNNTGNIYKYGTETKPYIEYLNSKGVDTNSLLINIPKSDIENKEQKLIGKKNEDLKWFINLSPDFKSKYIGRGFKLSNKQFDYLIDNNLDSLLKQHLNIGVQISKYQFNKIEDKPNILKTYIKTCFSKLKTDEYYEPNNEIMNQLYKLGYFKQNIEYPNNKDNNYYNAIINPTIELINKHNIDIESASEDGHLEVVKVLTENGRDVTVSDNYAIRMASNNGHLEVVKVLIENGADVTAIDNLSIIMASKYDHLEVVRLLIENGADVTARDNLAIRIASGYGRLEVVKLLIENGADVRAEDNDAIKMASKNGSLEVVKLLIENGVDVRAEDNDAIKTASYNGHSEVVKVLIENGADVTVKDNYAIRMASKNGHSEVVKVLIGNDYTGVKVNLAIRLASEYGHLEIVKLLIENGVDASAEDNYAIIMASKNGRLEIVKLLIENGAGVTSKDNLAIRLSSYNGYLEVVKLLIENGADVTVRDNYAIKMASKNGHSEVVELLKSNGGVLESNSNNLIKTWKMFKS